MTITDVDIKTPALVGGGDTAPAGGWKPGDGENKEGDSVSGKFYLTAVRNTQFQNHDH